MKSIIVATVALLALAGCGSSKPKPASVTKPATFQVDGILQLHDSIHYPSSDAGRPCDASLSNGYNDIVNGAQVVVYDAAGKILASGELYGGTITPGDAAFGWCQFRFVVPGVSGDGPYSIEVTHRGKIVFTKDQADNLSLTIGS